MEKKIILTIREDIYLKNDKTEAQVNSLLEVLPKYGVIEDFDVVVANKLKEKEEVISNLGKHIEQIKDYAVSEGELVALKAMREDKEKAVATVKEYSKGLERTLTEVKQQNKAILNRIKSAIPEVED